MKTSASVSPTPERANMAFGIDKPDHGPNEVRVNVTEGAVANRLTLPREVYAKSKADSWDEEGHEVADPRKSYVIVDDEKYPQTINNGRSNKIHPSVFGAGAGDLIVLKRVKGRTWVSAVKKGKGDAEGLRHAPVSAKRTGSSKGKTTGKELEFNFGSAKSTGTSKGQKSKGKTSKGKSADSFRGSNRVENPFAPKSKSKSKAPHSKSETFADVLKDTCVAVKKNAKAQFYNENVRPQQKNDYRVFLKSSEHKRFKTAATEEGLTLKQAVVRLAKACESGK